MIITCPECDTRYTVKAAAFTAPGRKVRCKNCGNAWFQAPPDDAPKSVEPAPEPDPPVTAPDVKPSAQPDPPEAQSEEEPEAPAPVITRPQPVDEAPAIDPAEFTRPPAATAFDPTPKKSRGALLGWGALVAFVLVFAGALAAFRGDVVRFWPATASVYQAVGLPVIIQGMEFRQVMYEQANENGLTVLSIRGEIVNVADERGPVPRVRVALRDQDGQELYHYFFAIPEAELDAGATAEFVTRLSSPPEAARDLVLRFVEPGEFVSPEQPPQDG